MKACVSLWVFTCGFRITTLLQNLCWSRGGNCLRPCVVQHSGWKGAVCSCWWRLWLLCFCWDGIFQIKHMFASPKNDVCTITEPRVLTTIKTNFLWLSGSYQAAQWRQQPVTCGSSGCPPVLPLCSCWCPSQPAAPLWGFYPAQPDLRISYKQTIREQSGVYLSNYHHHAYLTWCWEYLKSPFGFRMEIIISFHLSWGSKIPDNCRLIL